MPTKAERPDEGGHGYASDGTQIGEVDVATTSADTLEVGDAHLIESILGEYKGIRWKGLWEYDSPRYNPYVGTTPKEEQ